MLTHTEVQRQAQAEIDTLLGSERLPTFADQEHLPYLSAVLKECLRWQVGVSLAIPHLVTEDDEYKGYLIPKGAIIMANSWQILNDPEAYPDPSMFKPERFLKGRKIDSSVRDPSIAAFGYGRRVW